MCGGILKHQSPLILLHPSLSLYPPNNSYAPKGERPNTTVLQRNLFLHMQWLLSPTLAFTFLPLHCAHYLAIKFPSSSPNQPILQCCMYIYTHDIPPDKAHATAFTLSSSCSALSLLLLRTDLDSLQFISSQIALSRSTFHARTLPLCPLIDPSSTTLFASPAVGSTRPQPSKDEDPGFLRLEADILRCGGHGESQVDGGEEQNQCPEDQAPGLGAAS